MTCSAAARYAGAVPHVPRPHDHARAERVVLAPQVRAVLAQGGRHQEGLLHLQWSRLSQGAEEGSSLKCVITIYKSSFMIHAYTLHFNDI